MKSLVKLNSNEEFEELRDSKKHPENDLRDSQQLEIGLDDMDPKAKAMIQKGYYNSFLVIENFEKMKSEIKMTHHEIHEDLNKQIKFLR